MKKAIARAATTPMTAMTMPATAPEETPEAAGTLEAVAEAEEPGKAIAEAAPAEVLLAEVDEETVEVDCSPVARANVAFDVTELLRDVVPAFVLVAVMVCVSQISALEDKETYEQRKKNLPWIDLRVRH